MRLPIYLGATLLAAAAAVPAHGQDKRGGSSIAPAASGIGTPLIYHVVTGAGGLPVVFVHGITCDHSDWDPQVRALSTSHQTVAVDLRGHGRSPGTAAECSIERYGADVAEVMRSHDLPAAVLVGHSLGCRVVVEAALQAPERTAGVILVDGSQFAEAMAPVMKERLARPDGFREVMAGMFAEMFTAKSDRVTRSAILARAAALPPAIGTKLLTDIVRYDVTRFTPALTCLRVPVMAIQTTYTNEKRERTTMRAGQNTPFLDMLRASVRSLRVEVIEDTGHFPQLDEPTRTNALLTDFLAACAAARERGPRSAQPGASARAHRAPTSAAR